MVTVYHDEVQGQTTMKGEGGVGMKLQKYIAGICKLRHLERYMHSIRVRHKFVETKHLVLLPSGTCSTVYEASLCVM